MKKILIPIVMAAMTFTCINAQDVKTNVNSTPATSVTQANDGFKTVKLEELSAKVQETIKGYQTDYSVKTLAYNVEKKLTKVTLVSKADSKEKVVVLNPEGKEVKE